MLIDVTQLVNAKEAARLCKMTPRWFLKNNAPLRHVVVLGTKGYLKQEVIEWNRQRLASLKRHWKRHEEWQESNHPVETAS